MKRSTEFKQRVRI